MRVISLSTYRRWHCGAQMKPFIMFLLHKPRWALQNTFLFAINVSFSEWRNKCRRAQNCLHGWQNEFDKHTFLFLPSNHVFVRMASNFMLDKPICILDLEAYQSTSRLIWRIALWLIRERVPKRDLKIYFNHELLNQLKWKQPMIQKQASILNVSTRICMFWFGLSQKIDTPYQDDNDIGTFITPSYWKPRTQRSLWCISEECPPSSYKSFTLWFDGRGGWSSFANSEPYIKQEPKRRKQQSQNQSSFDPSNIDSIYLFCRLISIRLTYI